MKRVFLIVLDSFGIGEAPDAKDFGDEGSNTLLAVSKSLYFDLPNLEKLGLFAVDGAEIDLWTNDGAVERKRYDHRTLGDCGNHI